MVSSFSEMSRRSVARVGSDIQRTCIGAFGTSKSVSFVLMRSVKKRRPIPRCESSTRYITVSLKGASTFSGYTSFWNTFIIKPFHYRDSLTQGSMSVKFPNAVETSTQIFVVFRVIRLFILWPSTTRDLRQRSTTLF